MGKLTRVAVVGAGRIGRGIALSCAIAGVEAVLVDLKGRAVPQFDSFRNEVRGEIERDLKFLAGIGLLDGGTPSAILTRVHVLPGAEAVDWLATSDLIFEGVPETLVAKRHALEWVGRIVGSDVIVASTSSSIGVDELAAVLPAPERFLNAHWLNPAHLMPLVEIGVGSRTSAGVVQQLRAVLISLGKVPVVCSASPGYIVPRIQALAMNEAARLVEEGVASAEDVDTAVRVGFGLRFAVLGLLEFIDWGGNDILYHGSKHLSRTIDKDRYRVPAIVENNMRRGRNGVRDGAGFYDYDGIDIDAYRNQRLEHFVRMIQYLGLLPPGLMQGRGRTASVGF